MAPTPKLISTATIMKGDRAGSVRLLCQDLILIALAAESVQSYSRYQV